MELPRATWFPNGLDTVLFAQEILAATGLNAVVNNTEPVVVETQASQSDVQNLATSHNPAQFNTPVTFSEIDALKFRDNTNALGILFPAVLSAGLTSVLTQYRPDNQELLKAVRRHKSPYYYQQYPIAQFTGGIDLNRLASDLRALNFFERVEIDGTDVIVYTTILVQNDSIETIVNNYNNPAQPTQPAEWTYTYTDTTYEPEEYHIEQLTSEITDAGLPEPIGIRAGTNFTETFLEIVFAESINKGTLDPIIYNHEPGPRIIGIDLEQYENNSLIQVAGKNIKLYGSQINEIVIDQIGQGDYPTIEAAINYYNSTGSTTGAVFILRPGTYIENNPLTIPARCNLTSKGIPGNTKVIAINNDQPLFIMEKWTEIYNVNTIGPTNNTAFKCDCSIATGAITSIQECVMYNCNKGIECYGNNAFPRDVMIIDRIQIFAASQNGDVGVDVYDGGFLIAENVFVSGNPGYTTFNMGLHCMGLYSSITMITCTVQACIKGIVINSGFYQSVTSSIQFNGVGLEVGPDAGGHLTIANCVMQDNTLLDLNMLVENVDLKFISVVLDEKKVSKPAGALINMNQFSERNGITYQYMTGHLSIGSQLNPTPLHIGGGDSHVDGLIIKLFDGATYTTLQPEDSNNLKAGDILYIGAPTPFSSIHIDCSSQFTLDLYQNGWANNRYSWSDCFVLFPQLTHTATVDNQVLYWIRLNIQNNGTVQFVRLGTDSLRVSKTGDLQLLGRARVVDSMNISLHDWIGKNTTYEEVGQIMGVKLDNTGYLCWSGYTSYGRDISYPITLVLDFNIIDVNNINVNITIDHGYISDINTIVGTSVVNSTGHLELEIPINDEKFWIKIRTAEEIIMYNINIDYYKFRIGKKVN